jgi:hypothetical protein
VSALGMVKSPMSPWALGAICAEADAPIRQANNPRSAARLTFMQSPFDGSRETKDAE